MNRQENCRQIAYKHGMCNTPTYKCWQNMKARCINKNRKEFKYYGARGIKVCERWQEFQGFFDDMGEAPKYHTIERRNTDGDYCPTNCYWLHKSQQNKNRRPFRKPKNLLFWTEDENG